MDIGQSTLLTAPTPELESLSFALADPESVGHWISCLPMANIRESAGQLRQATFEIARLHTGWATRLSLLEGIRPTVLYLTARLDKTAGAAGNQADAISRLSQRIQTNLCSGYCSVVLATLPEAAHSAEAKSALSLAVHRALTDLSMTLLRTLQFYVAPAHQLWLKLNQLYHLAEQLGIEGDAYPITENNVRIELSICSTYLRSLLLAMARPYQLRHRQLADVYHALGRWAHLVSLSYESDSDIFVVDLASDLGPEHVDRFAGGDTSRAIRAGRLTRSLKIWAQDLAEDSPAIPSGIDPAVITHLADAWGEMKPRAFGRYRSSEPIKVSVGMRSTHYFLSGGTEFSDLLGAKLGTRHPEVNPFLSEDVTFVPQAGESHDVWEDAFDVNGRIPVNPQFADPDSILFTRQPKSLEQAREVYVHHDTTSADSSPGGYRLRWNEPFPSNLQTGELIGLRYEKDSRWCLAVARWIRQDETGPYMGVELLAPQARPIALKLVQSRGGANEYQRAFLLPELKPIGQPATLLTPFAPFRSGQKVQLLNGGVQSTAQLGDCLTKTGSFNQFTFRMLDGYLERPERQTNMKSAKNRKNTTIGLR
ncbi:MAG TPA: hypothetical protein VIS76_09140 [Pseudomonadales bacterium]